MEEKLNFARCQIAIFETRLRESILSDSEREKLLHTYLEWLAFVEGKATLPYETLVTNTTQN